MFTGVGSALTGNSIDVCVTFDTTGSMYPCLTQVRRELSKTIKQLFRDVNDLRIAIIAHGDYCDRGSSYVTEILDFSTNVDQIVHFVNNVGPTYGGDAPECYELVLREARTKLNWQSGRAKVIVMIGDDVPHGPEYRENVDRIDWRNELGLLLESNINVYGVHAMPGIRRHSKMFYEEIARKTGGFYLTLDQFANVTELVMAVCYKQSSDDQLRAFMEDLKNSGRLNRNMQNNFKSMMNMGPDTMTADLPAGIIPVPTGRFQVMGVDSEVAIKDFVLAQGVNFKKGRGFYELTKSVEVQQYKEIILMDKTTGDMFSGSEARELLNLAPQTSSGGITERLRPGALNTYKVFIQSTSVNRKLLPGTSLLYEVEDWERAS